MGAYRKNEPCSEILRDKTPCEGAEPVPQVIEAADEPLEGRDQSVRRGKPREARRAVPHRAVRRSLQELREQREVAGQDDKPEEADGVHQMGNAKHGLGAEAPRDTLSEEKEREFARVGKRDDEPGEAAWNAFAFRQVHDEICRDRGLRESERDKREQKSEHIFCEHASDALKEGFRRCAGLGFFCTFLVLISVILALRSHIGLRQSRLPVFVGFVDLLFVRCNRREAEHQNEAADAKNHLVGYDCL